MDDATARIGLPLVQAGQAQKHVTVNEALARIDALVPLVIAERGRVAPPEAAAEGSVWAVPTGATGAWAGQDGRLALAVNGGWVFVAPQRGWGAFIVAEGCRALHDGTDWRAGALTLSPFGAGLTAGLVERDHEIGAGTSSVTGISIPAGAMVIGVTARVLSSITGNLSGWRIGTTGATDRFGSGLGLSVGSWGRGMLGTPMTYHQPAAILLTAEGGSFAAGRVRLALHYLEIALPSSA